MKDTQIAIKNMVCPRCIKVVSGIFQVAGVQVKKVDLGVAELEKALTPEQETEIRAALEAEGFAILDDQRVKLAEQIKKLIVELVHYKDLDEMKENLSDYLSHQLQKEYSYLSNLFSTIENTTIEQYFILQKTEKVKEWLIYDELTLGEMAFKLGYSSVAHLSAQFKKITSYTPSQFKKLKEHNRKELDSI